MTRLPGTNYRIINHAVEGGQILYGITYCIIKININCFALFLPFAYIAGIFLQNIVWITAPVFSARPVKAQINGIAVGPVKRCGRRRNIMDNDGRQGGNDVITDSPC